MEPERTLTLQLIQPVKRIVDRKDANASLLNEPNMDYTLMDTCKFYSYEINILLRTLSCFIGA